MTEQNPFEGLGGAGGFDMNALLAQAQQMQAQLEQAQTELASATIDGSAGGVTVTVTGTGELSGVRVPTGTFDGGDADDLADLGDLVVAAYRDAKTNADAMAAEKLGPLAGGLGGLGGGDPFGGGALPGSDTPRGPAGF